MTRTPSTMMPLGTRAPDFELNDTVSGKTFSLGQLRGSQGTLVMFICNHCPYVIHIIEHLSSIANSYHSEAIGVVAICSNDAQAYPADSPEKMREFAQQHQFKFPYLHDDTQAVAKAYDAACTPDFFLFDTHLECVYRGQFDASRPKSDEPVTGDDLVDAIEEVLGGKKPDANSQQASMGCNIKWKT